MNREKLTVRVTLDIPQEWSEDDIKTWLANSILTATYEDGCVAKLESVSIHSEDNR